MKVIEKIKSTKGLAGNFEIKSKKVQQLVNEVNCIECYYDGEDFVFITNEIYKSQGSEFQLVFRSKKMKNGTYRIVQN